MLTLLLLLAIPYVSSLTNDWLPANTVCLQNYDGDYELTPCSSIYVRCINHRTLLMQCHLASWVFSMEHRSCRPRLMLHQCKLNSISYFEATYCTGKVDGLYANGACSASYVICFGQRTYPAQCQHNQVFSPIEHMCVDRERLPECKQQFYSWTFHSLCANRFVNGVHLPLAACSSEYIACHQGIPTFENCTTGYTFNVGVGCVPIWQNPYCKEMSQVVALHNLISASQFCVLKPDGIYIPQMSVCSSEAIVCTRNRANLLRCPDKHYYSIAAHSCLPADMRWCNHMATPHQTDLSNQLIAYSCARFGQHFHGPDKCSPWYLRCYPEKQSMLQCAQGTVYDQVADACVVQSACNPWNVTSLCSINEGNRLRQLRPCSETYVICYEGRTIIMTCPNGLVFSAESNACVDKKLCNHSLWAKKAVTICSPTRNYFIPIAPCVQQYLGCWNGHLQTLYCTDGLIFDPNLGICIEPSSSSLCGHYDNNPCKNRANGLHSINHCSTVYLRCDHFQPSWLYCMPGSVFDPVSGSCVLARLQACTPEQRTICQGRMDGPIDPWSCTDVLIVCLNGVAIAKPCPNPLPKKVIRCINGAPCGIGHNPCSPWINDQRALEPCSATYVACLYGYPYSQVCPDGKVFFNETQTCVLRTENRFCFTNPLCSASSNALRALQPCSGTYILCLQGKPFTQTCPYGQVFYNVTNSCVPTWLNRYCLGASLGSSFCSPIINDKKALAPCSGTYIVCLNGRPFTQACPNGHVFYNETSSCTAMQNNRYCPTVQTECIVEGEFIPDLNDCTIFYRCTHGRKVRFTCPIGTGFNPQISACDWKARVPSCRVG
ncbi:hypothetical protein M513_08521 [Trichuris suis]|uniref:Chitin-binding type-2 domain-containing protein n=1 Tax=Trichuris suis TaxID=68888 RepID=A0A085M026_9BILA|nr:hypothetical protein M513_08521 [Trichuris suis]